MSLSTMMQYDYTVTICHYFSGVIIFLCEHLDVDKYVQLVMHHILLNFKTVGLKIQVVYNFLMFSPHCIQQRCFMTPQEELIQLRNQIRLLFLFRSGSIHTTPSSNSRILMSMLGISTLGQRSDINLLFHQELWPKGGQWLKSLLVGTGGEKGCHAKEGGLNGLIDFKLQVQACQKKLQLLWLWRQSPGFDIV